MTLSLRARVLTGMALVAIGQIVTAFIVISITSDQILDQVDVRLVATAETVEAGTNVRTADVYQGVLAADGELRTVYPIVERGRPAPGPELILTEVRASRGLPFTAEAERGQDEYRVVAIDLDDGSYAIVAGLLDGYEWTITRLIRAVVATTAVVGLVLAAVAWWVIRLGIRPVKQMTTTAEAIAAGDLSGRIETTNPHTEVGQLGEALNTMMGRIEDSFAERTRGEERLRQFIADASHELRTPVATIRGYAELYEAGGLDERRELDDAMRRTRAESERMSRLIADMLHLAKLDRDPTLTREPVDLAAIVRESIADASARHPERSLSVEGPESAVVEADADLLRQAVGNLVANAIVHTDDAAVTVSLIATTDTTTVSVTDNGGGMAPEAVARATERFYRADPSRSRNRGGSGLGLAIAASNVAAHRGTLEIDSAPGGGTTVTITVPTRASDSQQTPS